MLANRFAFIRELRLLLPQACKVAWHFYKGGQPCVVYAG